MQLRRFQIQDPILSMTGIRGERQFEREMGREEQKEKEREREKERDRMRNAKM